MIAKVPNIKPVAPLCDLSGLHPQNVAMLKVKHARNQSAAATKATIRSSDSKYAFIVIELNRKQKPSRCNGWACGRRHFVS
jgi:hypothetical protein